MDRIKLNDWLRVEKQPPIEAEIRYESEKILPTQIECALKVLTHDAFLLRVFLVTAHSIEGYLTIPPIKFFDCTENKIHGGVLEQQITTATEQDIHSVSVCIERLKKNWKLTAELQAILTKLNVELGYKYNRAGDCYKGDKVRIIFVGFPLNPFVSRLSTNVVFSNIITLTTGKRATKRHKETVRTDQLPSPFSYSFLQAGTSTDRKKIFGEGTTTSSVVFPKSRTSPYNFAVPVNPFNESNATAIPESEVTLPMRTFLSNGSPRSKRICQRRGGTTETISNMSVLGEEVPFAAMPSHDNQKAFVINEKAASDCSKVDSFTSSRLLMSDPDVPVEFLSQGSAIPADSDSPEVRHSDSPEVRHADSSNPELEDVVQNITIFTESFPQINDKDMDEEKMGMLLDTTDEDLENIGE